MGSTSSPPHRPWSVVNLGRGTKERDKTYLDVIGADLDLTPGHGLVWARACVAPVEFLCRVDVDGRLGPVPHQARIRDVVFDNAATENDHAGPLRANGDGVDAADVFHDVDLELLGGRLEGVEIQHIAQAAVRQGWAEDGDVILVGPIIH